MQHIFFFKQLKAAISSEAKINSMNLELKLNREMLSGQIIQYKADGKTYAWATPVISVEHMPKTATFSTLQIIFCLERGPTVLSLKLVFGEKQTEILRDGACLLFTLQNDSKANRHKMTLNSRISKAQIKAWIIYNDRVEKFLSVFNP